MNKPNSLKSLRLQHLTEEIQKNPADALHRFWEEIKNQGTPLIEPGSDDYSLVTFLWRDEGSARNIAVIQDWGTDGIREHHMTRLPESDVWYLTRTMRSDTRTTYQLSPSCVEDPNQIAPKLPVQFWLQVGNLETARMLDGGPTQLAANQYFRAVLQTREYPLAQALTEIFKGNEET